MTGFLRKVPRLLWHAVVFELAMYRNLLRWVVRRPSVGPGDEPVGYAQLVTPVMCLWIFASAAEVPLLHILLPWQQRPGRLDRAWGMDAGLDARLAGRAAHPAAPDVRVGLRVRNGGFVDIRRALGGHGLGHDQGGRPPSSMWSLQPLETEVRDRPAGGGVGTGEHPGPAACADGGADARWRADRQPGQLLGRRTAAGGCPDPRAPGQPGRSQVSTAGRMIVVAPPHQTRRRDGVSGAHSGSVRW